MLATHSRLTIDSEFTSTSSSHFSENFHTLHFKVFYHVCSVMRCTNNTKAIMKIDTVCSFNQEVEAIVRRVLPELLADVLAEQHSGIESVSR
jgi:hypothetical protein